jgi:hypothetical protein
MHLTIAHISSRKDSKVEWFIDSLRRELNGEDKEISIVIVDRFYEAWEDRFKIDALNIGPLCDGHFICTKPKPSVFQGDHRLTKEDWFAVASARNTALCFAPDGWIAFVDDLSVLMPGWLRCVREAMAGNYFVCGAYKKVRNLQVENGIAKNYEEFPGGMDGRWKFASGDPCPAEQGWLFGCSCAMPVEALLTVNGWNEVADGIGLEDCTTGAVLVNAGYKMMYDRRMLTLESEEHHHIEPAMRREDWHFENGKPVLGGNGSDDCSHALLNIALGSKRFEYDVGGGFKDIRELRQHVLNGGEFPIRKNPEHHWYTRQLLSEL